MTYLNLEAAKKAFHKKLKDKEIDIIDSATLVFQWGFVFYFQSKEFIETGKNGIIGTAPILVDRVNGSVHILNDYLILDKQLEIYREKEGYPQVIKFPVKGDLTKMTGLEKVFALMDTRELAQIEEAIKMVKDKKLFDLEGFEKVCCGFKPTNMVENIAAYFKGVRGEYILYESPLKTLPKEITLFKDRITSLYINLSKLEELPDFTLELKELTSISVDVTPIKKLPLDLRALTKLRNITLERTKIKPKDSHKFILPKGCKLIIK